jgi:sporulation protein YlmC with PRC-barrel domain
VKAASKRSEEILPKMQKESEMQRHLRMANVIAMALCAAVITITPVSAQTTVDNNPDQTPATEIDATTMGPGIRASQLIGMNIQNDQGKGVGEVQDIVLNSRNGQVRYVAVTYGGFLGFGNKLFAVPYEAFRWKQDPDDRDDYIMVLNVTQEKLKGAEGFDDEQWPSLGDRQFLRELDKRYGVKRRERGRDRGVDVEVGAGGVNVEVGTDRDN